MQSNPTPPITHSEWSEHIATWRSSPVTRIEYCQQHGLSLNAFIYQAKRCENLRNKKLTLVPMKVEATLPSCELVLRGPKGWSVTMAGNVSPAWLGDLLGRLS